MNRKSEEPLWLYVGKGPGRDLFVRQFLRGLSLLHSGAEAAQGGEAGGSFAGEKAPLAAARAAALRAAAGGWLAAGAALLPPGAAPLRLNSGAAAFAARSAEGAARRLAMAGLAPAMPERCSGGWAYRRRCTVTVFGLRAVHAAEDGTPFESGLEPDSPQFRRLERAAVKALYAQGLDFGQVLLQAGNAGWEIARITELPDLSAPDAARLFAGAVLQTARDWAAAQAAADRTAQNAEKRAAERELPPDGLGGGLPGKWAARGHEQGKEKGQEQADNALLIGMDPEFLLFDQSARKIIPASRFLQTSGRAGADSVRIQGRRRFVLAELRPEPAGEPREAVLRLMAAMREASSRIADKSLQWLAGGLPQPGLPLGGHLHFSGVLLTPQLLRALDHFLAIPIAVLEDRRSASRRPRYGCLGDFRRQSHGGFEYRTLPSFLVSPSVTKGAVALALLVAAEYKAGRLPEVPPVPEAALKAFYTGNREALRPFALKALEAAESLASYESFQAYIAPMFQAVREGRTWDESRDIRRAWRLTAASEGQAD